MNMHYKIAYYKPTTQYIPVEAKIQTPDDVTELQFPMWRPGRYELGNFPKNIHSFQVINDKGKLLKHNKTSISTWNVDTNETSFITVKYRFYANTLNAGSSFMDDQQLYVNPVNLLIYVKDQVNNPCSLELDIPENFKIACGARIEKNTLDCASYHELVDSPFIASSNIKELTYVSRGIQFHIWVQGEPTWNESQLLEDFKKFSDYQLNLFDGFSDQHYHFLLQILPIKAYHGVEHLNSTVIALGPGKDLNGDLYNELLGVSSHELYHVWNIKSIRPAEMYPYDYSKENYTHLGYVAEGVTTYMGDLLLAASNVKDFNWYKKEFETLMQRHFDNFGRFNFSVAESSFDTWLDGYVMGAPNRKVSIYNEGALLTFVCDITIRTASNNKYSIHDVMNALYTRFALKNKGYTADDYFNLMQEFSGIDFTTLREKYFYGTSSFEPILVNALNAVGLDIKMEVNPDFALNTLGVKYLNDGDQPTILTISPGSSAELGGVIHGDKILEVNREKVIGNFNKLVEKYSEGQIYLKVQRMGREIEITVPHTNKSYYPIYKLLKHKAPSNLAKRIFKSWCGYKWEEVTLN